MTRRDLIRSSQRYFVCENEISFSTTSRFLRDFVSHFNIARSRSLENSTFSNSRKQSQDLAKFTSRSLETSRFLGKFLFSTILIFYLMISSVLFHTFLFYLVFFIFVPIFCLLSCSDLFSSILFRYEF